MSKFTAKHGVNIQIKLHVDRSLAYRLKTFSEQVRNTAIKKSLKEMAKPIVKAVSAAAPVDLRILKRNIVAKVLKSKRTKDWSLRIGARNKKVRIVKRMYAKRVIHNRSARKKIAAGKLKGKVTFANPSKYSHLVNLGTARGVKATNYLNKGLEASKWHASQAFMAAMKIYTEKAAQEAGRAK